MWIRKKYPDALEHFASFKLNVGCESLGWFTRRSKSSGLVWLKGRTSGNPVMMMNMINASTLSYNLTMTVRSAFLMLI